MKPILRIIFFVFIVHVVSDGVFAEKIVSGSININTADEHTLRYLPGIGEKRAKKIIRSRGKKPFREPSDLLDRSLIPKATFKKIQKFLTVVGNSRYDLKNPKSKTVTKKYADKFFNPYSTYSQVYLLPDTEFFKALKQKIHAASSSVFIGTYVFIAGKSPGNGVFQLTELLAKTVKKGVAVSVLFDSSRYNKSVNDSNIVASLTLKKNGIAVYFDDPKQTMHSKLAVIDNRWVFIGSHNMTHSALKKNREYSVMLDSPDIAYQVTAYLNSIKR